MPDTWRADFLEHGERLTRAFVCSGPCGFPCGQSVFYWPSWTGDERPTCSLMRVLVACERSGTVRNAFRRRGVEAFSADTEAADDDSPFHIHGDVRLVLGDGWDLMIAHPPCTFLSVSGMHWTTRGLRDPQLTEQALSFVRLLMEAAIARICIENPVSVISSRIRKPDQIIQPWQFGDDASKKTSLWLRGLPPLRHDPSMYVAGRIVGEDQRGRPIRRWANQCDSGQNKLGPSVERAKERSRTYHGIAEAMAEQWTPLLRTTQTK